MGKLKLQSIKRIIMALGFAGFIGSSVSPEWPKNIHRWLLEMHRAQIELLKIDWGQPGFCGEWDRDYSPTSRSCGKRGKLIERHYR